MKPLHPSSFHIFISPFPTDILYSSRPTLCIWKRIFSRSRGDTTVLDTAPATPPAQNAATTGWAISSLSWSTFGPYLGLRMSFPDYFHASVETSNKLIFYITHGRHLRIELEALTRSWKLESRIRTRAHASENSLSRLVGILHRFSVS